MLESPFLGVHRHAAVVAHVLVAAGSDVEQGRLAAVRVAHQGDADHVVALGGDVLHRLFEVVLLPGGVEIHVEILMLVDLFPRLLFTDDFDARGFLAAERHLIPQDLVLDRILQRGVEHDADGLALDETHLDQALAETAVTGHFGDHGALSCLQVRKEHTRIF